MKDTVSVKTDDGRKTLRKLLLKSTVHKAHQDFLKEFPDSKVSYSKFRSLRPKNVVLQGSSGSHITCVCVKCENPRLMVETSVLGQLDCFRTLIDETGKTKVTVTGLLRRQDLKINI